MARQCSQDQPVDREEIWSRDLTAENSDLVTECEDLRQELVLRSKPALPDADDQSDQGIQRRE